MLVKEVMTMTFNSACKFCYEDFKKEYNTGIGNIQECKDYWIFYRKTNEPEYGVLPILVYKGDKQPVLLTFDLYLELSNEIENSIEVEVPKEFEN